MVNLAVLACALRATTEKVTNFLRKKCTSSTQKILAMPMTRVHKCFMKQEIMKVIFLAIKDVFKCSSFVSCVFKPSDKTEPL